MLTFIFEDFFLASFPIPTKIIWPAAIS